MADPWRATTPPGALRSTPTPRRSRHVHVRDRLKSQAVPPQSWIGTARGWGRFTAIPNQCKHRGTADPAGSSSQDRTMMPGLGLVLVFHSLIYSLHLITSMLNLVWPLFRLGGVLWGRLLPPSLPSPLPCPGRGMRDLEGLSTEVPLGFTGSPPGMVKTVPPLLDPTVFSLLSLLNCFIFYQYRLPACLHAPHSASVQLTEQLQLFVHRKPLTRAASAQVNTRDDDEMLFQRKLYKWSQSNTQKKMDTIAHHNVLISPCCW